MTSPMPAYRRPLPPSTRIHKISFAPVLSATFSRDSCWITSTPDRHAGVRRRSSYLLRLLQDLGHPPPLGGGKRPGLHQQHTIPDTAGVLLVVGLVLLGTAHDFAVLGVLHAVFHGDDNGLVHLVADHETLTGLAVATGRGGCRLLGWSRAHCAALPSVLPSTSAGAGTSCSTSSTSSTSS